MSRFRGEPLLDNWRLCGWWLVVGGFTQSGVCVLGNRWLVDEGEEKPK